MLVFITALVACTSTFRASAATPVDWAQTQIRIGEFIDDRPRPTSIVHFSDPDGTCAPWQGLVNGGLWFPWDGADPGEASMDPAMIELHRPWVRWLDPDDGQQYSATGGGGRIDLDREANTARLELYGLRACQTADSTRFDPDAGPCTDDVDGEMTFEWENAVHEYDEPTNAEENGWCVPGTTPVPGDTDSGR